MMKWPNGCVYVGLFNKDAPNGYGVFKWPSKIPNIV
jgi:hypothetical protein